VVIPNSLFAAYRNTAFEADTPKGRLSLRVGQRCAALDVLLTDHRVSTWAYVTAYNPGSMRLSDEDNAARHHELEEVVAALGLTSYPGEGLADDRQWPPERSFLILGIALDNARILGRQYGQLAVVCGELGSEAKLVPCTDE
jgi:hypothetical protein